MNFNSLPQYVKHILYISGVAIVAFGAGKYGPQKKIDVTKTSEFTLAVDAKVAEVRASLEQEYAKRTTKVIVKKPDGTSIERQTTEDTGKRVETKTETKVEYKDRVVEKTVEKTTVVENKANQSVGVFVEPIPLLKQEWNIGVSYDHRVFGNIWVTSGFSSNITKFTPRFNLGVRMEF